tara:strand:+ start:175 stop:594 length:420 start_codon:yes stop_codon:yes gene_type:complete
MPNFIIKQKKEEPKSNVSELAVKGKYGEANRLVSYLNDKIRARDNFVLEMLWEVDGLWAEKSMFDYVIKFDIHRPYKGLTEIKDYTNKKGVVSKAHFNCNRYMGSVKQNGDKPIACDKYEVPNREGWTINDSGKFVKKR